MIDQYPKEIESAKDELLTEMEEYLSPDLREIIEWSYKLSRKKPADIRVITSNSTSTPSGA